jgi:hypothetical protein
VLGGITGMDGAGIGHQAGGGAGSSISEALGSANTILERLFQWREEQRRALELGENLNADAMLDGFDAAALGESMR